MFSPVKMLSALESFLSLVVYIAYNPNPNDASSVAQWT